MSLADFDHHRIAGMNRFGIAKPSVPPLGLRAYLCHRHRMSLLALMAMG